MIRLLRTSGFLLILGGALVIIGWSIEPLRDALRRAWPHLRSLPWPIQLGACLAALGLVLLVASLIWERIGEREQDRELLDDEP